MLVLSYRLAMNNVQYLGAIVGIKDPIHRQKISVKAMDVVLFGPPKDQSSHVKDITLVTLLVAAIAGAVYTYRSNRHSKQHLTKLMEHMEILSSAEKELQDLHVIRYIFCKMIKDRILIFYISRSNYSTLEKNRTWFYLRRCNWSRNWNRK